MPREGWSDILERAPDNISGSHRNAAKSASTAVGVKQSSSHLTIHARSEQLVLSVPPPVVLDEYCKNYPDAPQKFFQWAEEEAQHRRKLDEKLVDSHIRDSRLGLYFGLIVALAGLGVAAWAVTCDQPWLAGFLGGGTIVSLTAAFIRGSQSKLPSTSSREKTSPRN